MQRAIDGNRNQVLEVFANLQRNAIEITVHRSDLEPQDGPEIERCAGVKLSNAFGCHGPENRPALMPGDYLFTGVNSGGRSGPFCSGIGRLSTAGLRLQLIMSRH